MKTKAYWMLFLKRQERKAKTKALKNGNFNNVIWAWKTK